MEEFCYIFRDTDDVKDVKEVIGMVDNYFALQEKVQQMSFRLRLKYWACTTVVYFYLQMNKQLGRDCRAVQRQRAGDGEGGVSCNNLEV